MRRFRSFTAPAALVTAMLLLLGLLLMGGSAVPSVWSVAGTVGALGCVVLALVVSRRDRLRTEAELRRHAVAAAVADERLAIARELHDVVSNGLALVTMNAGVAGFDEKASAARLRQALVDVERTSRATARELRHLLQALRGEQGARPALVGELDLDMVVAGAQAAGLHVDAEGVDVHLHSPAVTLAVHRVLQEALANVVRHAGPTTCRVTIARHGADVEVVVADAGAVPGWHGERGSGTGLLGLRERVTTLGGRFWADRDGAGFVLRARIPDPGPGHD